MLTIDAVDFTPVKRFLQRLPNINLGLYRVWSGVLLEDLLVKQKS